MLAKLGRQRARRRVRAELPHVLGRRRARRRADPRPAAARARALRRPAPTRVALLRRRARRAASSCITRGRPARPTLFAAELSPGGARLVEPGARRPARAHQPLPRRRRGRRRHEPAAAPGHARLRSRGAGRVPRGGAGRRRRRWPQHGGGRRAGLPPRRPGRRRRGRTAARRCWRSGPSRRAGRLRVAAGPPCTTPFEPCRRHERRRSPITVDVDGEAGLPDGGRGYERPAHEPLGARATGCFAGCRGSSTSSPSSTCAATFYVPGRHRAAPPGRDRGDRRAPATRSATTATRTAARTR